MLYLVHGSDEQKARIHFQKLVSSLKAKRPDTLVFIADGGDFNPAEFEEIVSSVSLFDPKYLIILKNFCSSADGKDFLDAHMKQLATTEHIVLMLESSVPKPFLTKISKYAEKVQEYTKNVVPTTAFSIFTLADALGERDRQKLWILYQEALYTGIVAEEIFWRFVGQVKNMLLVARSSDPHTIKLHPFVLQKTKRALKNFSVSELIKLSSDFVTLYDDARNGRREFETSLEKMILGL